MRDVMSLIERMASSFPGIGYVMLSGSQLLSMMAMTGISNRVASWTAIRSTRVSSTKTAPGRPRMFLMPVRNFCSLTISFCFCEISFFVRPY